MDLRDLRGGKAWRSASPLLVRRARNAEARERVIDAELRALAIVVVLGTIMSIFDTTIVNVAIDTLGRKFHATLSTIQWVSTAYLLALAIVIPLTGWSIERFGAKRMYLISLTPVHRRFGAVRAGLVRRQPDRLPGAAGPRRRHDPADRPDHPGPRRRARSGWAAS